jgi:CRP-like cAMP-binding protein
MEIGRPYSRLLNRLERSTALSPQDRQGIAELPLRVTYFSANQELVQEGTASARCTLVLNGFLYSHKLAKGSKRQITSFLVPGDLADLQSLFLPNLDCSFSALGPAVVAFLPHASLKELLDKSPKLTAAFWRETFIEAAIFREWLTSLGRRDAIARIAHVFCELATRLQAVQLARNLCFSIPWTQTDVADACGISTVHANRVVQELRRRALVDWDSKQVRIRNWEALAEIADFSGAYLQLRPAMKEALPLRDKTPEHVWEKYN